ncbi:hypothetical protein IM40_07570 [Candidatus Paracaedimonas acanthamoebae]|nr:hypothetical protein IM40_07570 [Candidatus Paracaedimonas acanthamoebae]
MHQQTKRKNYLWALLGLSYSSIVLGEKKLDLKEEEFEIHAEVSTVEVPMAHDIIDEKELQSSMLPRKPQDFLFVKSDNLMDHLVSSGSTPFTQSEMLGMTVSATNLDTKSKEALDRQKEWLAKLIEAYLQQFTK